jgi:hypothetical protein
MTKPLGRIKFQGCRIDIRVLDHANNNEDWYARSIFKSNQEWGRVLIDFTLDSNFNISYLQG